MSFLLYKIESLLTFGEKKAWGQISYQKKRLFKNIYLLLFLSFFLLFCHFQFFQLLAASSIQ
ncbi:hypothetical protein A946_09030 [Methylacidiphilum kamchatkense Kam1]|uniref:Uncharacterized protein n=1 Tax=Methylacidiphilum kamchatkense Kam1 TaxID=1202785 RepID=A0ABR4ZV68_9BACT|nr:hypothetical protein A946_09030 [Methylacidiphilum kamchatkense Kam1]